MALSFGAGAEVIPKPQTWVVQVARQAHQLVLKHREVAFS